MIRMDNCVRINIKRLAGVWAIKNEFWCLRKGNRNFNIPRGLLVVTVILESALPFPQGVQPGGLSFSWFIFLAGIQFLS